MVLVTLFLRGTSIVDRYLLLWVVLLPFLVLVLLEEVNDKEGVLEIDEKVAHVCFLLRFFLIGDNVECRESVLVVEIDFFP